MGFKKKVLHNKFSCLGTPKSFDDGVYVIEDLEMETEGSVAKRLLRARESFEKQQLTLLSTLQSLQLFKIKFVECVKEKDALLQKVAETELSGKASESQHAQELEQLRQDIARAHGQSQNEFANLSQQLEANQSEIKSLRGQLTARSEEVQTLQEKESKLAQEIEKIRAE